jgi:hypothetical protein
MHVASVAVLGSACSHRPVFKALALFDRAPVVDSSVQVIGSNGNTTAAAGIDASPQHGQPGRAAYLFY